MNYTQLTTVNRIADENIPNVLNFRGVNYTLPETLKQKNTHWLIDAKGELVRAAWISLPLAHLLNSMDETLPKDVQEMELMKAMYELDKVISDLIQNSVVKSKKGPGAMSFAQANENVPKNCICISERSYERLCQRQPAWKNVRKVAVTRFPNLGPGTTTEFTLLINTSPDVEDIISENSIGSNIGNLKEILSLIPKLKQVDSPEEHDQLWLDSFYLHPEVLKGNFEGDADSDLLYMRKLKYGKPLKKEINFTRQPADIKESDIATLYRKAGRVNRSSISTWLPIYFDDTPIGPCTYAIRWITYCKAFELKDRPHPMHEAWSMYGPEAGQKMEFVMDFRKGDHTTAQIKEALVDIQETNRQIARQAKRGNWFAKTVTCGRILDIPEFLQKFDSLQDYLNLITFQKT